MRLVASARARRHDMFARYREWDGGNQKLWTKKIIVFCFLFLVPTTFFESLKT